MDISCSRKLFYSDKAKFFKIFIYIYLFLNIIEINFPFKTRMPIDLFNIVSLILVIILFVFSNNLIKISQKKIYKVTSIFLFILILFLIIYISGNNAFIKIKNFINLFQENNFMGVNYYYQLGAFYILAKYRYEDKDDFIYVDTLVISIIINLILFKVNSNILFSEIELIFNITILVITSVNINKKNIKTKCIDLLKINFLAFTILLIITFIKKYFNLDFDITELICIRQAVAFTSFIIIINSYIEKNYNFIFKETNEIKVVLDDLNVRAKINNYKLEESLKKLKERQNMYKDFLDYSPNPVIIINEKSRLTYSNKEFLNLVGEKNIKNIINKKLNNLIGLDLRKIKDNEFLNRSLINFKDNEMEVTIISLNKHNEKNEYILLFKELTEERKILEMKEQLENKKMKEELKKNFLSSIYHDLKTPVNIIYSATQLEEVLIENNDIEKLKNYNNVSKENCITLTQLTNNLIDMSKIDYENISSTMELGNIVEFIEDYLENLTDYIKNNNINLLFDPEQEEILIYFDKEMMKRIILNLVSNSLKFTKEGGEIRILIKEKGDKVSIEFSDNGIGMSKEFLEKIFNKYEKENRESCEGSGIGLFVVYNLVKAQGGDIEIKSFLNKGTTFIINLKK